MDAAIFWDLASKVGLPFALVALALWTGRSGIWVWGREIELERKRAAEQLEQERKQFAERLAQQMQQSEKERIEVTKDRDYFRDFSFEALYRGETIASKVEQAVGLAERGARRHP